MKTYLVDVVMVTYNHEKYIAQAIDSVLMQEANFPFRLIIGEDCSNDNTLKICRNYTQKYPDIIKFIAHDTNQGLLNNYKIVFNACTAKYLSILEGDDYWIDEKKLQHQVDYLENHPDVGLVHSNCNLLFESGKLQIGSHKKFKRSIKKSPVFEQLLEENYIRTATVMMRKSLYDKYISIDEYIQRGFKTFDYPAWLDIAQFTKFYYFDYSSANYRIHNHSISQSNEYIKKRVFYESTFAIKKYAIEKNNCNSIIIKYLRNIFLTDLITLEMSFKNYHEIQNLKKELKTTSLKSLILKILTLNKHLINTYYLINKKRQRMIETNSFKSLFIK